MKYPTTVSSFFSTVGVLLLALTASTLVYPQTTPRKFYSYDVVATSDSNLTLYEGPSINDFGDVAFSGKRPNEPAVFLSRIGQPTIQYFTGGLTVFDFVAAKVHLNNSRHVLTNFFNTNGGTRHYLRRITGVETSTLVASSDPAFNDFAIVYDDSFAMNGDGEAVFLAQSGIGTPTVRSGERPFFSTLSPPTGVLTSPAITDFGDIVARAGSTTSSPLRLYNYNFSSPEIIASTADGFTSIGQSPGISADFAEVIVFYGVLNQAGADTIGTNPGPGIFASIEVDKKKSDRRIIRLTGRLVEDNGASGGNDDGICDAGETCIQGELGFNLAGNPIFFTGYNSLSRIGVAHQSVGALGIEDDIFVVSFGATPNIASDRPERPFTNQEGIWTLTTQIKSIGGVLKEQVGAALPVIQYGDVVNGRTITQLGFYDPIASVRDVPSTNDIPGGHRLTFYAGSKTGNMIIRAIQNVETPVVFIPGILGSTLFEDNNGVLTERWLGPITGLLTGANIDRLLLSQNPLPNIIPTDVLRDTTVFGVTKRTYGPLLEKLTIDGGGLREYQVEGKPERRTLQGCDMNQRFNNPTLFVFAYDWRKSNIETAGKLKDYIQCIQKFYPGTKIDIVAHSMGGLVARRHIINNPGSHNVRKMITVGSPFLGAPKALEVIETGRLRLLTDFLDKRIPTFLVNKVKALAKDAKSVHELFPSSGYYTLGGRPFVEETFDINNDSIVPQIYNYQQTFDLFNARFSNLPYQNNQTFHGASGQDDWSLDTSGVEFFHIFGEQSIEDTVEQITAKPVSKKPLSIARRDFRFTAKLGEGDGTVPTLSAERIGKQNFNFSGATLRPYVGDTPAEDKLYEHTGLVKAPDVLNQILTYLDLPLQARTLPRNKRKGEVNMPPSYEYKANSGLSLASLRPPKRQGYYVTIEGIEKLDITDNEGNTNTDIGDMGFELAVPGVRYFGGSYSDEVNVGFHGLSMPAEAGSYTIKFRTGTDSIDIEVLRGIGNSSPNMAIRYIDLDLPPSVDCIMTFSPQGVPDLAYDSNGDGTYDVVVPAHVRVTGTAAQDVTAPAVTLTYSKRTGSGRVITINAVDSESGVQTIYYRVGETGSFKIYEGSFHVSVITEKVVEAFADDNVGNRSSPIRAVIPDFHTR